ncbi:hypothetical protein P7C70_g9329, partial [Phenoliferia sp. Uapishka_3]
SSRSSSPPLETSIADLQANNTIPESEFPPRTTRQAKEWRAKSTLRERTFWERTWAQRLLSSAVMDESHHTLKDGNRGPVPSMPMWFDHAYLIPTSLFTPVVQQISMHYGYTWSAPMAFGIYFFSLVGFFMLSAQLFSELGKKFGTFNEEHRGRDHVPDDSADVMAGGIITYFVFRVGKMILTDYDRNATPLSNFGWDYIIRFQLWFIVMDCFFYTYHRSTHEFDFLWRIHQQHHRSKAPTMISSALAGHAQHFIEIILIPSMTTYIVPMSFHEQWVLYLCLAYVETIGHSGIRVHVANTNTWLSCLPFGADLNIEDHDLHHRYGKSGKNYGKQTRVWDKIFGTMEERVETKDCKTRWI